MSIIKPWQVGIKDFQEITVAIDALDDIFSDFDPRPLAQRALSEDFLKEIQKFYRESAVGGLTVVFLGPLNIKKQFEQNMHEKAIINHLRQEFKRRANRNRTAINQIRGRGLVYLAFGTALLLTLTLLGYFQFLNKLSIEIIGVLFMPLGWFGVWDGFSKQVDLPFRLKEDLVMYENLAKAQYSFKFLGETPPPVADQNKTAK
jgi:hypothetical protein